jgi:hypothetical protein
VKSITNAAKPAVHPTPPDAASFSINPQKIDFDQLFEYIAPIGT